MLFTHSSFNVAGLKLSSMLFYKNNPMFTTWKNETFRKGILEEGNNNILITLIPKCQCALSISQFRPISLCNTVYKIITKIMVARIQSILQTIILHVQEVDSRTTRTIKRALANFMEESSQSICFQKSRIVFSSKRLARNKEATNALNIKEAQDLGEYLGFAIHSKRVSKLDHEFIVNKVRAKLCSWKANMLSQMG
ncbi:hypothetical protein PVK06_032089 [Gossypium arboreum]|uniref:Reverse transcriptase n=1 Tax=Gossypium arboreum TaxID=29729 RepID=A0ABR0NSX9_GOSAR|nr:hypothetical protein PVK06_032089 [Gossypium arboreum]